LESRPYRPRLRAEKQPLLSPPRCQLNTCFSASYDPELQLLYLAVIVRDDELFVGCTSPVDTDSIEVYVDGLQTD